MTVPSLLSTNSLPITRGTNKTLQVTVKGADGRPMDLTGATVFLTVKRHAQEKDPLILKTSEDSSQAVITNPICGIAQFYLVPADTQTMEIGQYVFDVWAILANSFRYCVVEEAIFDLHPGVTVIPL